MLRRTLGNRGEADGGWSPDWIPWYGKYISLFGNEPKQAGRLKAQENVQWKTGLIGLKIDQRKLVKSSLLHTKGRWAVGLGHVESIFQRAWKGEELCREEEEVKVVGQNSPTLPESLDHYQVSSIPGLSTPTPCFRQRSLLLASRLPAMHANFLAVYFIWWMPIATDEIWSQAAY